MSRENTIRTNLLKILLQSSFLPKLYGKGKEYTKRGHTLEPHLARKLFEDSSNKIPGCPKLAAIYENGMIAHQKQPWCKDSNDYSSIMLLPRVDFSFDTSVSMGTTEGPVDMSYINQSASSSESSSASSRENSSHSSSSSDSKIGTSSFEDGEVKAELLLLEMKSRLGQSTTQEERERHHRTELLQQAHNPSGRKYFTISSDDECLKYYIDSTHEAIQILHHPYSWKHNRSMLVIGDDHADIIWGITVNFEDELLDAYGRILEAIFNFTFRFVYEAAPQGKQEGLPTKDICLERAMNALEITRSELDLQFRLKRFILHSMRPPFPPVIRIVPFWIATWNANKSGSDTYSKILATVGIHIPIRPEDGLAQPVVVGQEKLMMAGVVFRCFQKSTATKSVSESGCLARYQNAAAKRTTYKTSLKKQSEALRRLYCRPAATPSSTMEVVEHVQQQNVRVTRSKSRTEHPGALSFQTKCTPRRNVAKAYYSRGEGEQTLVKKMVTDRFKNCPGHLCQRINPAVQQDKEADQRANGGSGRCFVCGTNNARWWCAVCHHFYCVQMSAGRRKLFKDPDAQLQYPSADKEFVEIGKETVGGTKRSILVVNSCALLRHKEAFLRNLEAKKDETIVDLEKAGLLSL